MTQTIRKTCAGCGAVYDDAAWKRLVLVERIETEQLRRLVQKWSDDACVEVRRCARCQRSVAARTATTRPAAVTDRDAARWA